MREDCSRCYVWMHTKPANEASNYVALVTLKVVPTSTLASRHIAVGYCYDRDFHACQMAYMRWVFVHKSFCFCVLQVAYTCSFAQKMWRIYIYTYIYIYIYPIHFPLTLWHTSVEDTWNKTVVVPEIGEQTQQQIQKKSNQKPETYWDWSASWPASHFFFLRRYIFFCFTFVALQLQENKNSILEQLHMDFTFLWYHTGIPYA